MKKLLETALSFLSTAVLFAAICGALAVGWRQLRIWQGSERNLKAQAMTGTVASGGHPRVESPATAPAPAPSAVETAGPAVDPGAERAPLGATDLPALQEKVAAGRARESIVQLYGPLFRRFTLDDDQRDRLEALLVGHQSRVADAVQAARATGVGATQQLEQAVKAVTDDDDSAMEAAIGPEYARQYREYRDTLPEEGTLNQLAARVARGGSPLSDTQRAQLLGVLVQMRPPAMQNDAPYLGMLGISGTAVTTAMVGAASGILSADQVSSLQEMQATQQTRAELIKSILQQGQN